jgi:Clp amino terminal domain, pathogenicity island component
VRKQIGVAQVLAAAVGIVPMLFALAAGRNSNVVFVLALAGSLLVRVVVQPLAVLFHELGHAVTAALLSGQRISLQVGQPDDRGAVSIGKIDLRLGRGTHPAHIRILPDRLSRMRLVCIFLAGPVASLLLAVALVWLAVAIGPSRAAFVPIAIAAGAASLLLVNLVPFEQRGSWWLGTPLVGPATDGLLALRALRGHEGRQIWNPDTLARRAPARTAPRLTSAAREVMRLALFDGAEAREVRPEHLLSALANEPSGAAGEMLRQAGVSASVQPLPDGSPPPSTPTSPALVKILERSRSLLTLRGDAAIDTEHLLLALLESGDETVRATLREAGADATAMRRELIARLSPA